VIAIGARNRARHDTNHLPGHFVFQPVLNFFTNCRMKFFIPHNTALADVFFADFKLWFNQRDQPGIRRGQL